MKLLNAGLATTSAIKASGQHWKAVYFYGTWDGATATLQQSANGTTWHNCRVNLATPADVTASSDGFHSINTAANYYRVLVASAGTTSITVEAL